MTLPAPSSSIWLLRALLLLFLCLPRPAAAEEVRRTPVVVAVERATPAVVTIEVEVARSSPFSFWYGPQRGSSAGSGVLIGADGVVLTNAHVVQGALSITAHTTDARSWPATVVALDVDLDLAVLQLQGAAGLPTLEMADSDALMLGETVIAIGNPYGMGLTVSTGVISSVRRQVEIRSGLYQNYIQTDAAINPGNSGGALVDLRGRLVGINTAIRDDAEGIGFAIPVNRARKIAEDMLEYGTVRAPWLGVDLVDVNTRALRGTPLERGAVRVARVWPKSPGASGGLKPNDLIFQVDGRPVASRADLNAQLAEHRPGATLPVRILRDRSILGLRLKTGELPETLAQEAIREVLGIAVRPEAGGLRVHQARQGGTWADANLRAGDLILAADGRRLRTEEALVDAIHRAKARHRGTMWFTVQRDRYQGTLEIGI